MKFHRVRLTNVTFTSAEAMPWEVHRDEAHGWPCPYCWNIMSGKRPRLGITSFLVLKAGPTT